MRLRVVIVQAVVVLALLEIGLRIYQPVPFRVKGQKINLPVREVTIYRHPETHKLDPLTRDTKNSLGFRGPEPPRDFAKHLTLLTIGGSTTECHFLDDGKTWTDVMSRTLQADFPGIWVNNAGLDGQSTYGHLVLLNDFVAALRPAIAVFLIGINDVGLERTNGFDAALTPDSAKRWHALETFLIDHSELLSFAQNVYRASRAHQAGFGHSEVDLRTVNRLSLDERTMEAELQRHQRLYLDSYAERVGSIVKISRRSGIEPVLVTQPALFGETVDPTTGVDLATVQVNGGANGALAWRRLEMYNDVTRRIANRDGVLLIDLAHEMPKDSRLFYDFLHFTNAGAERVGLLIAAGLAPHIRTVSKR
jgi:lysophospholipase L1-like esterase